MPKLSLQYIFKWLWYKKEAVIWICALIFLALSNPADHFYTLCPLENLGFHYCPGCGLGHSISYFFHLEIKNSFLSHPLGIPAVILLVARSVKIVLKPYSLNYQPFNL